MKKILPIIIIIIGFTANILMVIWSYFFGVLIDITTIKTTYAQIMYWMWLFATLCVFLFAITYLVNRWFPAMVMLGGLTVLTYSVYILLSGSWDIAILWLFPVVPVVSLILRWQLFERKPIH